MVKKSIQDDAQKPHDRFVSDAYLQSLDEQVKQALASGAIKPQRRAFFDAMHLLQTGDIGGAILGFRRAARDSETPFEALSMVSLGECERALGREASAIRDWTRVASAESAPQSVRSMAWLSIAAMAEKREDAKLAARADAGLKELTTLASADEHQSNPD